jgi:GntR family transcriptional regulator
MQILFHLSQADARPMYIQIMDGIKRLVIAGDMPHGQPLPSIRELAVSLKVSVITVKRAYQELEREGFIVTHHGRGSYVADKASAAGDQLNRELNDQLHQVVVLAKLLNLDVENLAARLSELFHSEKSGD